MKNKISYIFFKTFTLFIIIFFIVSAFYSKNLRDIYTNEANININIQLNNKIDNLKNTLYELKEVTLLLTDLHKSSNSKLTIEKKINSFLRFNKKYSNIKVVKLTDDKIKSLSYYNDLNKLNENDLYLSEIKSKKANTTTLKVFTPILKDQKKISYLCLEYSSSKIFEILNNSNKKTEQFIEIKNIEPMSWLAPNTKFERIISWEVSYSTDYIIIDEKIEEYLNSISWIVFLYFIVVIFLSYLFAEYKKNEVNHKLKLKISNNVFENSHDGIIITNHDNKIIRVNKSFTKITGYEEREILNKSPKILKSTGYHTKQFYKNIWDSLNTNGYWEGEITNKKKDGTIYTEDLSIRKISTEDDDTCYIASFVDITESKKNKKLIEDKLDETKTYLEIINDYLISLKVDLNGHILDVSDAFCQICGYSKKELIGNSHDIFRHPDTTKEFYLKIWNLIYSGKTWEGELKNLKKNGEAYYVHAKISPIYSNNTIIGYASIAVDITDKKRVEEMSITDELTQIYNRRYFNITIEKEILRAKRDEKALAFAILDIDYFKQYNDTYGHIKGDKALIEVAKVIKSSINRASDYAFRLGGEEFGILVTDIDEKNFKNLLERVKVNIENLTIEHKSSKVSSNLTASFGGVIFKDNIEEKEIYKTADKLLYKSKAAGRNRVIVQSI